MSHETTRLQAAVSAYLRAHLKREGRLPTAEEIAGQLRRVSADIVNASLACALPGRQPAPASDQRQSGTRSTRSPTSRQLAILGFNSRPHSLGWIRAVDPRNRRPFRHRESEWCGLPSEGTGTQGLSPSGSKAKPGHRPAPRDPYVTGRCVEALTTSAFRL
jgi:hypothetical protein